MCIFSLHIGDACSIEAESSDYSSPASLEYDTRRIGKSESGLKE